jgi:hypothetical protein
LVLSASRGPNLGQVRSILSHPPELTECEISNLQMAGGELVISGETLDVNNQDVPMPAERALHLWELVQV